MTLPTCGPSWRRRSSAATGPGPSTRHGCSVPLSCKMAGAGCPGALARHASSHLRRVTTRTAATRALSPAAGRTTRHLQPPRAVRGASSRLPTTTPPQMPTPRGRLPPAAALVPPSNMVESRSCAPIPVTTQAAPPSAVCANRHLTEDEQGISAKFPKMKGDGAMSETAPVPECAHHQNEPASPPPRTQHAWALTWRHWRRSPTSSAGQLPVQRGNGREIRQPLLRAGPRR